MVAPLPAPCLKHSPPLYPAGQNPGPHAPALGCAMPHTPHTPAFLPPYDDPYTCPDTSSCISPRPSFFALPRQGAPAPSARVHSPPDFPPLPLVGAARPIACAGRRRRRPVSSSLVALPSSRDWLLSISAACVSLYAPPPSPSAQHQHCPPRPSAAFNLIHIPFTRSCNTRAQRLHHQRGVKYAGTAMKSAGEEGSCKAGQNKWACQAAQPERGLRSLGGGAHSRALMSASICRGVVVLP